MAAHVTEKSSSPVDLLKTGMMSPGRTRTKSGSTAQQPFGEMMDNVDGLPQNADIDGPLNSTSKYLTKKAAFRRFLTGQGMHAYFIRSIVSLYEEDKKPDDALSYICSTMAQIPSMHDVQRMKQYVSKLRVQLSDLSNDNEELRKEIKAHLNSKRDSTTTRDIENLPAEEVNDKDVAASAKSVDKERPDC